jgi:hypothetical protein
MENRSDIKMVVITNLALDQTLAVLASFIAAIIANVTHFIEDNEVFIEMIYRISHSHRLHLNL